MTKTNLNFNKKIIFCDFETTTIGNEDCLVCCSIVAPFILLKKCLSIKLKLENNIKNESFNLTSSFLLCLEQIVKIHSNATIASHNLNHFNVYFIIRHAVTIKLLIDIISKANIIYKFYIQIANITLEFRNTYLLTEMTLDQLASTFTNKQKKSNNVYQNEFEKKIDIHEKKRKCIERSVILSESFSTFLNLIYKDFHVDAYSKLTLAALALHIFKTRFYNYKKTPIKKPSEDIESCIRTAYLGGIVDVYKPLLENGYHYDVNSLYPYVMIKHDFPIGNPKFITCSSKFVLEKFFGFLYVEVTSPKNIKIPFLPYKHPKKGLISPIGTWTSFYFSEEIKEAVKFGYSFKFIYGIEYKKGKPFISFVNSIYNKRINNAKLNEFYKKILNSLYGRLGIKHNENITKILSPIKTNEILQTFSVEHLFKISEDKFLISFNPEKTLERTRNIMCRKLETHKKFAAVQLAAAITSYARIEMYTYKTLEGINIFYTDTDSIFCDNEINPNYVSSIELGKLKLVNKIKIGLFVTPKAYYICNDNNIETTKLKGIQKSKNMKESLFMLFKGKSINIINSKFFRDLKTFKVENSQINITISGELLKRDKIFNEQGIWINTKPIFYNEKLSDL